MLPTLRNSHRWLTSAFMTLAIAGAALGQANGPLHTGHAIPGIHGFESSVRPVLGLSYDNTTVLYTASIETDRKGSTSGSTGDVNHISNHTTATWLSPWRILGGNYVARLRLSLVNSAPNPRSLSAGNSGLEIGDTYLEPFSLYWPGEEGTVSFRFGTYMSNGSFDSTSEDNAGKGFDSYQAALGVTHYITEDHLWHYSILTRYSVHSKVKGLNLRPGDDVVVDWNVGKHVNTRWNLGFGGYGVFQTSRDHGGDANEDIGFYGTGAIGFLGRYSLPDWGGGAYFRLFQEFNSYNRTEGQQVVFGVNFTL